MASVNEDLSSSNLPRLFKLLPRFKCALASLGLIFIAFLLDNSAFLKHFISVKAAPKL
tara:strand:+ start:323 stop:496 length:174 start_codon:yes stop_codon:yes gene_type:complete